MASELRSRILEADDIQSEIFEVEQWGGVQLLIVGMSGKARAKRSSRGSEVDLERFYPELVIATAHDPETEEKVFEAADRDALSNKSGAALEAVAQVALRLSGMGPGAVEEAVEDLEEAPNEGSISN